MFILRDGKLVDVNLTEDSGKIIAIKSIDEIKEEQAYQADKIMRAEEYVLDYNCDKGMYIFMLTQTPYGDDPVAKKFGVGGTGCGYKRSKGEAIMGMKKVCPIWNQNAYRVYIERDGVRVEI